MQALANKRWTPEGHVETRYRKARKEWDDRMGDAVIPARNWRLVAASTDLSAVERKVYDLVARRYLAQFVSAFEFDETTIDVDIAGERFRSRGRQTVAGGWRVLFSSVPSDQRPDRDADGDDVESARSLPLVREGGTLACAGVSLSEEQTRPPRRFTDATLIEAMTGRQIVSTSIGRALIAILPEVATRPDDGSLGGGDAADRRGPDVVVGLSRRCDQPTPRARRIRACARSFARPGDRPAASTLRRGALPPLPPFGRQAPGRQPWLTKLTP